MTAKSISISLPEAMIWKLDQLEQKYGIPRSSLMQKALLLLAAEMKVLVFEFGEMGEDVTLEDVEAEYLESQKASAQP